MTYLPLRNDLGNDRLLYLALSQFFKTFLIFFELMFFVTLKHNNNIKRQYYKNVYNKLGTNKKYIYVFGKSFRRSNKCFHFIQNIKHCKLYYFSLIFY